MASMANISTLRNDLRKNKWHITAFHFSYNGKIYIVVFEDIGNLPLVANEYIALLTFIDQTDGRRILQVKANDYKLLINAKDFREYFGIQYSSNLGDIFRQFYSLFGKCIPTSRVENLDKEAKYAIIKILSHNDKDNANAQCCYKAIRNGIYAGVQHHRTVFNSDKTKLLREELFNLLGRNDDTISFCYREGYPLDDSEICKQFAISYGV